MPSRSSTESSASTTLRAVGREGRAFGRGNVPLKIGSDDTEEARCARDPAQIEFAEIVCGKGVAVECDHRRLRGNDLAAVRSLGDACGVVHREPDVALARDGGPPGVQPHANADRDGPRLGRNRPLARDRGVDARSRRREDGEHLVASRIDDAAAGCAHRLGHERPLTLQHRDVAIAEAVDEARRALDVREEKGDFLHRASVSAGPAVRRPYDQAVDADQEAVWAAVQAIYAGIPRGRSRRDRREHLAGGNDLGLRARAARPRPASSSTRCATRDRRAARPRSTSQAQRPGDRRLRRRRARAARARRHLRARASLPDAADPQHLRLAQGRRSLALHPQPRRRRQLASRRVRLRLPPAPPLRAARATRRRRALPRAVRRPRVPDRRRAPDPQLRRGVLRARLGHRRVLPPRTRPRLPLPAHVRRVRPARGAGRRGDRRQRDRRRRRDLRARREGDRRQASRASATASGPRRRSTSAAPSASTGCRPARTSSTSSGARRTRRGARRHGPRRRHRRADDGGGRAARRSPA